MVYNDEHLHFFNVLDKYEGLRANNRNNIWGEISNWHFPCVKKHRLLKSSDNIVPLDKFMNEWDGKLVCPRTGTQYPKELLDMKMLDKNYIRQFVEQFDM
ncbi:hypothetical protein FACS1894139_01370 [Planctomycetales bacterium]|nr:hypothetical protein FACS1894139_01370 [Planctomycetales bacterium]